LLKEDIVEWMNQLKILCDTHYYPSSLIFNIDETMLHLGKNHFKVLIHSTGQRPIQKIEQKGEHITFVLCISANGHYTQPLVIFLLKTLPQLPQSFQELYAYTEQTNGWIDQQIYQL
jgi:hypothetical protein